MIKQNSRHFFIIIAAFFVLCLFLINCSIIGQAETARNDKAKEGGTTVPDDTQEDSGKTPDVNTKFWYVASNGKDTNDGQSDVSALATVSKALSLISADYKKNNRKSGEPATIIISGTIIASGNFGSSKSMVDISGIGKYPPIILKGHPDSGGVLDANIKNNGDGRVLYVANNKVTLGEKLRLTGGKTLWGGAVIVGQHGSESEGEFIMSGGEISGNFGDSGAAVMIYKGSFEMSGGVIKNNHSAKTSSGGQDGAVYVSEYTTFTMKGGDITDNGGSDTDTGGAIYVGGYGSAVMSGGNITKNHAARGGGVYIAPYGDFTITNGNIKNNTASQGGGVYVSTQFSAKFNGKDGTINGNTPDNVLK